MGQRIITFDDYDGTTDDTVAPREFGVGRNGWRIDLSEENYQALLDALGPWIERAKKVRGPGIKAVPTTPLAEDPGTAAPQMLRFKDTDEPARLAEWAARNHVLIARPGRPPKEVLAAFRADDIEMVPTRYRLASA